MASALPIARPLTTGEILSLFASLEPDPDWSFATCTSRDTGRLTHGYHRYPAKFIPQLVDKLMDEYLAGVPAPTVNDLFMGSGTTIACAIARGYHATGTDVSEVAYLITRAKATPIDPQRIEGRRQWLYGRLEPLDAGYVGAGLPCLLPDNDRLDYWFRDNHKRELGQILAALLEIEDEAERSFFLCGFSHVLKNCSIWDMDSTKPTRDLSKEPRRPWPTYLIHLQKMAGRNGEFWKTVMPAVRERIDDYLHVRCQDARRQPCADGSVDLQITSSPYVTSYEYADLHQLSALWLNHVDDLRQFRTKFIGTARPTNHRPFYGASSIVHDMLAQMERADNALVPGIQRFFSDMRECFAESYRILKLGGHACYVIGNTRLKGVPILNAEAFAELMQEAGFVLDRVILRQIPLKTLPQTRDASSGRFKPAGDSYVEAYPTEYILVARKDA